MSRSKASRKRKSKPYKIIKKDYTYIPETESSKSPQKKQKEIEKNPWLPESFSISSLIRENSETVSIKIDDNIGYKPGQFVMLSLLNHGEEAFAICSSSENPVEILVSSSTDLANKIKKLSPGEKILLRGPYGKPFPIETMLHKNMIIAGSGEKLGYLRSIISYIHENRPDFGDVLVFLEFENEESILFKQNIKKWEKDIIFEISIKNLLEGQDKNKTDILETIKKTIIHKTNTIAIVGGNLDRVKNIIKLFEQGGFEDSQIWICHDEEIKCGIGKCESCRLGSKLVCRDGPIFVYKDIKDQLNLTIKQLVD